MTPTILPDKQRLIEQLFSDLPEEHDELYSQLKAISTAFHQALAKKYEPVFNRQLATLPFESLLEKQDLATTANRLLRDLHLSVQAPNQPEASCILSADRNGNG